MARACSGNNCFCALQQRVALRFEYLPIHKVLGLLGLKSISWVFCIVFVKSVIQSIMSEDPVKGWQLVSSSSSLFFNHGRFTLSLPSFASWIFSVVGSASIPSSWGLKGRDSASRRLTCAASPLAKSYITTLGKCFQLRSKSTKSLGDSALMLNLMEYTIPHGHVMTAQPPKRKVQLRKYNLKNLYKFCVNLPNFTNN